MTSDDSDDRAIGLPDGGWCGPYGRHLPVVVSTRRLRDGFRLRYLLRCWGCDLRWGPFNERAAAEEARRALERR